MRLLKDNPNRRLSYRDTWIPGFYAWAMTVALPCWQARAFGVPLVCCGLALSALVTTVVFSARLSRLSLQIGLVVFLLASALTWLSLGAVLEQHLDPIQGGIGTLGWFFFVLGWSHAVGRADFDQSQDVTTHDALALEQVPAMPPPRSLPRREPRWAIACSLVLGIAVLEATWWITGRERTIVARLFGGCVALSLLGIFPANPKNFTAPQDKFYGWGKLLWVVVFVVVGLWLGTLAS